MIKKRQLRLTEPDVKMDYVGQSGIGEVDDRVDIIKQALSVHQKRSRFSSDLIFFPSSEEQQKFVRDMYANAEFARILVPDSGIGAQVHDFLVDQAILMAILNRNIYSNPILSGIFTVPQDDGDKDFMDKLKDGLSPKK